MGQPPEDSVVDSVEVKVTNFTNTQPMQLIGNGDKRI